MKIKCKNDDEEISKSQPQLKDNELSSRVKQNVTEEETVSAERISGSPSVDFFKEASKTFKANLNDLLANGINKFFGHVVQASYKEWFDATFESLSKDYPVISEKFVFLKVKCKDQTKHYAFYSHHQNYYDDQQTNLNIFNKGWKHENTEVSILHPNSINKSIQMKEGGKSDTYHHWSVNTIPKEYIGEDGYFIVLCLKKNN